MPENKNAKYRLRHMQNIIGGLYEALEAAKTSGDREERIAIRQSLEKIETSYYKLWDKVYNTKYAM